MNVAFEVEVEMFQLQDSPVWSDFEVEVSESAAEDDGSPSSALLICV